ncbi:MAG: cell division protein ZipA C-terminal FtsZ-binding domain-containing protein [Gallionellaceae bacterium]|jgi:FtsZ-interacting cell division protein ZipA|nr:cell division protein ZipA C-terminal FtsZ-binding domain-containing protein [Gallionellaceae bacterium]
MSEFQISLLGAGAAVVLLVLVYNLWQRRRLRRRFDAMFQSDRGDALTESASEAVNVFSTERVDHVLLDDPVAADTASPAADTALLFPDEITDYVATLSFDLPRNSQALTPLWQQRFDFGKTIYVCGMNAASGVWEKVIPESLFSYLSFKLSLQLADRSGAVSAARLEDFRNLARDIAARSDAHAELPDVAAAAARAKTLDNFCAEVDQLVGLNIVPSGERKLAGGDVASVAAEHGMMLQADGSFQLFDDNGITLFSLINSNDAPFQHHTLAQTWVDGLTLLLDVPRVEQPVRRFEEMAVLARQIAMDLRANVMDDNHVALGEPGVAQIREQVADIEDRMRLGEIAPGSAQARRLFS